RTSAGQALEDCQASRELEGSTAQGTWSSRSTGAVRVFVSWLACMTLPTPSEPIAAGIQELCAQCRTLLLFPPPESGAREPLGFTHAAHLHAQVASLEIYGATVRSEHGLEGVDNLLADSLLHTEALGEHACQSGELGDTDDRLVGDVPNVRLSVEGQ